MNRPITEKCPQNFFLYSQSYHIRPTLLRLGQRTCFLLPLSWKHYTLKIITVLVGFYLEEIKVLIFL